MTPMTPMTPRCFSNILITFLFLLRLPFSAGQDVPAAAENTSHAESAESLEIRVSVNEVRLDVVVLDKKGNQITDLTADDFEVFQNNKRQEITSSVYIDSQPGAAAQPVADQKGNPSQSVAGQKGNLPSQPAAALKKEDVRRTILFVVDDYVMTFENSYYTKIALRNFVEKQMQPGDLVAILRTDYGNSALNMFHSDKRETLARINALPPALFTGNSSRIMGEVAIESQLATLSYSLRAVKNMPGRKILIMMSKVKWPYRPYVWIFESYKNKFNALADDALRAGVVVNLLDMDGLYSFKSNVEDASERPMGGLNMREDMLESIKASLQRIAEYDSIPIPNPLPDKTGGVVIEDSNFFLEGIGRETESLMRGYYLVSYEPPPDTFKEQSRRDDYYRRIKVRVKREGAKVYTRDGFFGKLESESNAGVPKPDPLIETIYSPFQSTDLNVDIAAGYVKDARDGYLVRSWVHLAPEDVRIEETEGGNRIDLEAIYVTSDINGNIADSKRVEFSLTGFDIDWIRRHGIRFSMLLPVKKPGPYYVRISIQDKKSGSIGSAYQFLEIPDLKKKGMALSNIFILAGVDDLQWMNSNETTKEVFFPEFHGEEVRSPALRAYKPGDNLLTMTMLYNADEKAISRSEIEIRTILYKDGEEYLRGAAAPVTSDKVDDSDSIPLLSIFAVGQDMAPGNYMLQLVATDKKSGNKEEGAASQVLGFRVVEK